MTLNRRHRDISICSVFSQIFLLDFHKWNADNPAPWAVVSYPSDSVRGVTTTNPAQLLKDLLVAGALTAKDQHVQTNNVSIVESVWKAVFGVAGEAEVARHLTEMYALPEQIRNDFLARNGEVGEVEEALSRIEAGSLMGSDTHWANYWKGIEGDHAVRYLGMASQLLAAPTNRTGVDIGNPDLLRDMVRDLLIAVHDSDLDAEVKRIVTSYLYDIEEALANDRTDSTRTVWNRIEAFIGRLAIDKTLRDALEDHPVGEKIRTFVSSCIKGSAILAISLAVNVNVNLNLNLNLELPPPDPAIVQLIAPDPPPVQGQIATPRPPELGVGDAAIADAEIVDEPK